MPNNAVLQVMINARDRTQAAFTRVRRAVNRLDRRLKRLGRRMVSTFSEARMQILGLVGAIGGFGKVVGETSEFELQMARVGTLGQQAREAVAGLSDEVQRLAVKHGEDPKVVADALFDVISAGASADDAIEMLNEAMVLSVAGVADLKNSVSGLATVANAFQINTAEGFRLLAQELNAAQIQAKSTISLISSNVGKLAATFAEAGISSTEMFVALADVTRQADSTEEAATSLRAALSAILKPADDLKKVMERIRLPMGAAAFEGRTMGEVFALIAEAAKDLGVPLQTLIPNVRAIAAVSALSGREGERFREALEGQQELLDELDKSYKDIMGTLSQAIKRFKALSDVLIKEFGEGALDGFKEALNEIADKDLEKLKVRAELLGLELRLAIEPFFNMIRITFNSIMFMVNSFQIVMDGITRSFDILTTMVITFFEGFKGLPVINNLFTSDVDEYNASLEGVLESRKELLSELDEINETFRTGEKTRTVSSIHGTSFDVTSKATADDMAKLKSRRDDIMGLLRVLEVEQGKLSETEDRLLEAGAIRRNDGTLHMEDEFNIELRMGRLKSQASEQANRLAEEFGENTKEVRDFALGAQEAFADMFDQDKQDQGLRRLRDLRQKLIDLNKPDATSDLVDAIDDVTKSMKKAGDEAPVLEQGLVEGFRKAMGEIKQLDERLTDLGQTIISQFTDTLSTMFDDIAQGTFDAKEAFKEFGRVVLRVMNDIIAEQIVLLMLGGMGITPSKGGTKTAAKGDVFEGGFQAFATGGVVNKPTLGLVGEGRFNEAIVPLPDGRSIPVDLRSNSQQPDPIVVNISAVDGASVEKLLATASGKRAIQAAMRDARATRRDLR